MTEGGWQSVRYLGTMAAVCFSLFIFATEFDETEWKALGTLAAMLGVGKLIEPALHQWIESRKKKEPNATDHSQSRVDA